MVRAIAKLSLFSLMLAAVFSVHASHINCGDFVGMWTGELTGGQHKLNHITVNIVRGIQGEHDEHWTFSKMADFKARIFTNSGDVFRQMDGRCIHTNSGVVLSLQSTEMFNKDHLELELISRDEGKIKSITLVDSGVFKSKTLCRNASGWFTKY